MDKKFRELLGKAVCQDSEACLALGLLFLNGEGVEKDQELAQTLLGRSMEFGNQEGYFTYHQIFSKGKKVIDDHSYQVMCEEYEKTADRNKQKELEKYLKLGTQEQRKKFWDSHD